MAPNNSDNVVRDEEVEESQDFARGRGETPDKRGPNWVYTIHKIVEGQYKERARLWTPIQVFEPLPDGVKANSCQLELCPETGKPHYQGYIQFTNSVRFAGVKKLLDAPWCWVAIAKASPEQNFAYTTKEASRAPGAEPYVVGKFTLRKNKGKRNDLHNVMDDIKAGKSIVDIAISNPVSFLRYTNNIRVTQSLIQSQSAQNEYRNVSVEVLIGPPGAGKSHYARAKYGMANVYNLSFATSGNTLWWDNYNGQSVVLLDDFYGSGMNWTMLLTVLDKYPLQLQVKGASTWAKFTRVIITSNRDWYTWYPMQLKGPQWKNQIGALYRRFSRILHVKSRQDILLETIALMEDGRPILPTYVGEARDAMDTDGKFQEDYVPNLRYLGCQQFEIPPDYVAEPVLRPVDDDDSDVSVADIRDEDISDAETLHSEVQSIDGDDESDDRDFIVMDSDDEEEEEIQNLSSTNNRKRKVIEDDEE